MITVKVDASGFVALKAQLQNKGKQVTFATMRALNAAAYKAQQVTIGEISRVFDKPTPWVRGSVRYIKARRDRLEAEVDFDRWGNKQGVTVADVLRAEIYGGDRKLKRHERALQRIGILPPGMAIVPGEAAKIDAFGNMSAGQINQIMAWFNAFGQQGYTANMGYKGQVRLQKGSKRKGTQGYAYFVLKKKHGKLLPGVYQRFSFKTGSAVKPVMIFVQIPKYKRLLDFYGIASRTAVAEFNAQFPSMLADAMRTSK